MNKRFLAFLIIVISICSCNTTPKVYTVAQVFSIADKSIDKEICVQGLVKHVCQHSGQRCFLVDEAGNSLKIEVSADLKSFPKEIMGKTIKLKGILKEQKISEEEINKMSEEQKAEKEGEHCGTESDNILKMREWMKSNSKDYYSFYYIEGTEYEIL